MNKQTNKSKKVVKLYFAASSKATESGKGPSGTAVILQYKKPCGGVAEKLVEAGHPLLTAPQAQMTAAIEGLLTLKQNGLVVNLVGNSADVEGWVTGVYQFSKKTKNRGLVRQLKSLMNVQTVTFCRPSADDDRFMRCKHFAGQMAEEQQKKHFETITRNMQVGAGAYMLSSFNDNEEGVQNELFA